MLIFTAIYVIRLLDQIDFVKQFVANLGASDVTTIYGNVQVIIIYLFIFGKYDPKEFKITNEYKNQHDYQSPHSQSDRLSCNENSAQRKRKHCALAVVARESKFSLPRRPLPGAQDGQEMDIYLYLQTQFGEDRCTQFRVIVVTDTHTQTHTQTGPITIHCAEASA